MPRWLVHRLADLCGLLFHYADGASRRVALANLEAAFGESLSPARRQAVARASARNLARTFFDLFWVTRLGKDNWRSFIEASQPGRFVDVPREAGVGAIFLCHHFGNWEWLIQVAGFVGGDIVFVAQQFKNPLLDGEFRRLREHSGCRQIPRAGALLRLVKALKSGSSTGMLTDLTVPPGKASVIIDAFGMKMSVTSAPAVLRRKLGCPIAPSVSLPGPNGIVQTKHFPPLEIAEKASDAEVMQACWDALEPFIREHPEYWIWVYKHWRYRPEQTNRTYPFYANPSSSFEKALAGQRTNKVPGEQ